MRGKKPKQPASLWEVMNRDRLKKSQEKVNDKMLGREPRRKEEPRDRQALVYHEKRGFKPNIRVSKPVFWSVIGILAVLTMFFVFGRGDDVPAGPGEMEGSSIEGMPEEREIGGFPPVEEMEKENNAETASEDDEGSESKPENDHIIVIASYNVAEDLKPVQKFFAKNGIETEIVKPEGSIFYTLVTKKRYESPLRSGTDGYYALANIKKTGSNYEAPKGYESFGKVPFQDAYGKKIKK